MICLIYNTIHTICYELILCLLKRDDNIQVLLFKFCNGVNTVQGGNIRYPHKLVPAKDLSSVRYTLLSRDLLELPTQRLRYNGKQLNHKIKTWPFHMN